MLALAVRSKIAVFKNWGVCALGAARDNPLGYGKKIMVSDHE